MKSEVPVIMLVLASDNQKLYKEFRRVYESYLNTNPLIKVFMVYGNPVSFDPQSYDLYFPFIEENTWPGMITKTIRAMEYVEQHYQYKFLVRTNISTFWVFSKLLKRLETLPLNNMYSGSCRTCFLNGEKTPLYVSGTGLILTPDLVSLIIKHQEKIINQNLPEDYAISQFLNFQGFIPTQASLKPMHLLEHLENCEPVIVAKEIEIADNLNKDHFRIKNYCNREIIDVSVAKILLKHYYNKDMVP